MDIIRSQEDRDAVLKMICDEIKKEISANIENFDIFKKLNAILMIDMGCWWAKLSGGPHRILNELSFQACKETKVFKLNFYMRTIKRPYERIIISFRKMKQCSSILGRGYKEWLKASSLNDNA
jgi:hypothetical protein